MADTINQSLEEGTAEGNKASIAMKGSPESISTLQTTPDEAYESILAAARATSKAKEPAANVAVKEDTSVSDAFKTLVTEAGLDESLVTKATALFEAAIAEKVKAVETSLVEDFKNYKSEVETKLREDAEVAANALAENVKNYSDQVAEKFITENKTAIENGLRIELAESLFSGLSKLFVEHNISLPESIDAVKTLELKVEDVTKKLNDQLNENIQLKKQIELNEASKIVSSVCEGLTAVQSEKVKSLAEALTYSSLDELKEKVNTVRESVVVPSSVAKRPSTEFLAESAPVVEEKIIPESMRKYMDAITKTFVEPRSLK